MKKKSSYIFLILIYFFTIKAFSKDNCNLFLEELKNNTSKYNPQLAPTWVYNDFGFLLEKKYIKEEETYEFIKDKNNQYKIGQFTDPNLASQLKVGDKLISVDGRKIGEIDLNFFEEKELSTSFDDNQKVKFEFETKELELIKKEKELFAPFSDFYLYSIEIDEKNKKLNARIHFESSHQFGEDDPQYILSKKYLWHDKREDATKDTVSCTFSLDQWEEENFAVPGASYFKNLHSLDLNNFVENLTLKPYTHEINWHKENRWGNELNIEYTYTGNYTFNTKFNYSNFPFDKQKIRFELVNFFDLGSGILDISSRSELKLDEFASENNISGWEIINSNVYHDTYKDPTVIDPSDVVVLELEIERQHGYYIYKVILPIVIILMVCWSSVFIAAKELESKLTITIVCLLSLIAYNFVIDNEIPKLEYLTIIDWIILASYFYAALPNILGIYIFNLYKNRNTKLLKKVDLLSKKYGLTSYIMIIIIIIFANVNINPEQASSLFAWMDIK